MELPILNLLLLAVLFLAGLLNFLFYFPTKRFSSWLQSLKPTSQIPHFKSSPAVAAVSASPGADAKAEMKRVFGTFDKNSDGFITKKELMESLKNIRMLVTEGEADEMFRGVDENGDGLIDFDEFCVLGEKLEMRRGVNGEDGDEEDEEKEVQLREAFGVFDKDEDGLITVEELSLVLNCLGLKEGKKVENCKEMIRKVDLDGDGMVNFDEFKRMMRSGGGLVWAKS